MGRSILTKMGQIRPHASPKAGGGSKARYSTKPRPATKRELWQRIAANLAKQGEGE